MALQGRSLYVTGLPSGTSVHDLETIFSKAGTVEKTALLKENGTFKGAAYVCMATKAEADGAPMNIERTDITVNAVGKGQLTELQSLMGDDEKPLIDLYRHLSEAEKKKFLFEAMAAIEKKPSLVKEEPAVSEASPSPAATGAAQSLVTPQRFIMQEQPKLSVYSGITGRDTSFGRWKHEVTCLMAEHTESVVLGAIRRSLRSPAADILMHVDQHAPVSTIMRKLEAIYGMVCTGQTILQKFYSDSQSTSERVAEWACRLEDLAYKAVEKGMMTREAAPNILKTQFWSGLRDARLKDALRHRRHTLDVDELIVEARELEEEYSSEVMTSQKATAQQQQKQPTEMELLMQLIKKMDARMDKMESMIASSSSTQKDSPAQQNRKPAKCTKCQQDGHLYYACRKDSDVTCHKCGKVGHIARGCRPLNGQ